MEARFDFLLIQEKKRKYDGSAGLKYAQKVKGGGGGG